MKPRFTIFTPTYNRGYMLPQLYKSLQEQSNKDFEWLIIDDGSTDNTEDIVNSWKMKDNGFEIIYKKINNGGKPRAINKGIQVANGTFFFIVDSDDILMSNAVKNMSLWCEEIENNPTFIGVGAARGFPNGEYLKGKKTIVNEKGYVDATNLERSEYNLDADMCEAYKTIVFKQFPMAEWKGENFAPEQIALNNIALAGYKLRWHAEIIYVCDYLEDGLTKGSQKLEVENPMGYAMMYNHKLLYPKIRWREKYHAACQHVALSFVGKNPQYILESNSPFFTVLALPIGVALSFRRKKQFANFKEKKRGCKRESESLSYSNNRNLLR